MSILDMIADKVFQKVLEEIKNNGMFHVKQTQESSNDEFTNDESSNDEFTNDESSNDEFTNDESSNDEFTNDIISELTKEIKDLKKANFNLAQYGNVSGKEISLEEEIDKMFN